MRNFRLVIANAREAIYNFKNKPNAKAEIRIKMLKNEKHTFWNCCKLALLVLFSAHCAFAMDFDSFYTQVHKQTLERNFVRFRHRIVVSREGYHLLTSKEKEVLNQIHALVLVFSKIDWFIYFNEQSGVGIATATNSPLLDARAAFGSYLQFDIRYYETLRDIGIGGDIKAMCVLPYFDKCILLGYEMF